MSCYILMILHLMLYTDAIGIAEAVVLGPTSCRMCAGCLTKYTSRYRYMHFHVSTSNRMNSSDSFRFMQHESGARRLAFHVPHHDRSAEPRASEGMM